MIPSAKIAGYELHPLAAKLPLMDEADFEKFAEDIKKNGLLDPIVLYAGKVLDGRHRLLACEKVGVQPRFEQWDSLTAHTETTPFEYVISKNFHRRQLSQSQKAIIALDVLSEFEQEAAHRQKEALKKGGAPVSAPVRERDDLGKASEQAAKAAGVSARSMESAKAVAKASPELAEKVRAGEISLKKAEKQIRREGQVRAAKVYVPPTGEFSVIVTDFPWKYDDALDGSDAVRGGCPYPPMTLDEIKAFRIPAAKDCVQFMNITHQHFLQGAHLPVLAAQGFTAKNWFTWKKNRIGTGHLLRNITEHVIIAVKGNPTLVPLTDQPTFFEADVGEHSEKPDELYALIEKMAPAPAEARLEMFARVPSREGWTITGSEKGVLDQKPPRKPGPPANTGVAGQGSVPLAEVLRECKVRGFTVELPVQEYDSHVARCDGCSSAVEFDPDQADKVEASVLEELREHTCSTTTAQDVCHLCQKPFTDPADPAQLGLLGPSAHESCIKKAANRTQEPTAQEPLHGWKWNNARVKKVHAFLLTDPDVSHCGASLGNGRVLKQGEKVDDAYFCRICVGRFDPSAAKTLPPETDVAAPPPEFVEKSLEAYRLGQIVCSSCGIHHKDFNPQKTKGAGWITGGTNVAGESGLPLCFKCAFDRKIARSFVGEEHREAFVQAVSGPPPAAAGDPNESVPCPKKGGCAAPAGQPCKTGSGIARMPHMVRINAREKAAKVNTRAGLCELQGRDAVKRCLLKDGHRGKCQLNDLKNRAAK